ncbi:3-keto-5-aminohexanoate cleavage protein [Microbacterium sp. Leaf288]|uniref:3-keto-5-aminohexanoate cleavage protein n=1 Tax=Microbacterium sp. Leaf288 TaxID=1736323 RepID=UPI0006F4F7A5|nr:3-keto-5-aminohexanoate cleavage protein [Microbacterium sp. Leaf288]KQP69393.1 3-keto-5-aminohexanoate cleavage protein [Microbacterium sp. Leaf288]
MSRPVIITVAPTGGMLRSDAHPHVPTQPDQIAADVARCVDAGASAAALHVRRLDETATCDPALYREVNRLVRERCDVVINNSSGGGVSGEMRTDLGGGMAEFSWPQRLAATDGGADTVTLDAITAWATVDGDEVLMNTPASRARELAQRIRRAGAVPEWEVFNPSHITKDIPELIAATGAGGPHIVNICLDLDRVFSNASPWTPRQLELMVDQLPAQAVFSVSVGGSDPFPALAHALILGGHIRVGLEDHPWHPDGSPATNLELVQRAVRLVKALGMRPATPDETRRLWGLVA